MAALMSLGVAACDCDTGFPELFLDDFERACDASPCDWAVEAGSARRVATFHPAEHGLELGPGTRLSRAPGAILLVTEAPGQPADRLQVLIDCEPDTGLLLTAEVALEDDAVVALEARVEAAIAHAGDGRLRLVRVPLAGAEDPVEGVLQRLRLTVEGEGRCVIDDLRLLSGVRFTCNG
jgi:hypothetical protein